MNDKAKQHYVDIAVKAAKRAVHKVAEKARQENRPLPIWKNGRVEFEVPASFSQNND
jgi:hypothetical protein